MREPDYWEGYEELLEEARALLASKPRGTASQFCWETRTPHWRLSLLLSQKNWSEHRNRKLLERFVEWLRKSG